MDANQIVDPANPYFYTGYRTGVSSSCDQLHAIANIYGPCPLPPPKPVRAKCRGGSYDSLCLDDLEDHGCEWVYRDGGYDNDGGDTYHYYELVSGADGKQELLFLREEFCPWD